MMAEPAVIGASPEKKSLQLSAAHGGRPRLLLAEVVEAVIANLRGQTPLFEKLDVCDGAALDAVFAEYQPAAVVQTWVAVCCWTRA